MTVDDIAETIRALPTNPDDGTITMSPGELLQFGIHILQAGYIHGFDDAEARRET